MFGRFSIVLFFIGLFFISCNDDKTSSKDMVLDIRLQKEPEKINPVFFPNAVAREIYQYIFLPLADYNINSFKLEPILIKQIPTGIEMKDGPRKGQIKYEIEFLQEAIWSDGKPVIGEDYLWTIKACLNPGTTASSYRSVIKHMADVELDPQNVKKMIVYLDKYYMLGTEFVCNFEILPKHVYDPKNVMSKYQLSDLLDEKKAESLYASDSTLIRYAEELNSTKYTKDVVVGNGPYLLSSWNANQNIILEKTPNYWGSKIKNDAFAQNVEKMMFHFIPDETAAIARLKSNEIDFMSGISSNNFNALKKDSAQAFQFHNPKSLKNYNIVINMNDAILSSKNVRKAIASITNVDQYISTFENGNGAKLFGPINPVKPYAIKNITPYKFDIDAAKNYLKADGWADTNHNGIADKKINGKLVDLNIPILFSGELGKNICLLMQEEGKKAGINFELNQKEMALIRKENLESGKYAMAMLSAAYDLGYEDLSLRYHSDNAELGEGNQGFYKNTKVDSLIHIINTEKDEQKRNTAYTKVQEIIYDDLPYIFLYSPYDRAVNSKKWNATTNIKRPGYQANTFTNK